MPKKQANSKTKKSQSPARSQSPPPPRIKKQKGKSNIGRPEDDEMETHFMQKKLQRMTSLLKKEFLLIFYAI
jgi:hypothetical protein